MPAVELRTRVLSLELVYMVGGLGGLSVVLVLQRCRQGIWNKQAGQTRMGELWVQ